MSVDREDRIKDIIDQECFENWHEKRCESYFNKLRYINTPCWVCDRNRNLAQKILNDDINIPSKHQSAVILGRLGGHKGGIARAYNLTPEQRTEIARKAAKSRWQNMRLE